jgi:hypothetical protein
MRPTELIAACQMFLVPASILFGALALAGTLPLRILISLMGVVTSGVWFYRVWFWAGLAQIDRNTVLILAGVFTVAWFSLLVSHAVTWYRERRPRRSSVLQRAA